MEPKYLSLERTSVLYIVQILRAFAVTIGANFMRKFGGFVDGEK